MKELAVNTSLSRAPNLGGEGFSEDSRLRRMTGVTASGLSPGGGRNEAGIGKLPVKQGGTTE